MLEIKDIVFSYTQKDAPVVDHVSLTVEPDERVGVLAPSGFGKTTLMKIISGYEKPDSGEILVGGEPVSIRTPKDAIRHGNYRAVDRETAKSPEEAHEIMRQVLLCDYFLGSTNAVTEDGILVNIDGNANRLAAFCFGPTHVLLIVGMNKVVKNEEAAMLRARNEAAPINAMRFSINTPCHKNGCCGDCVTPDTICCQFLTTRYSKVKGRIQIILVEEDLGY